MRLVDANLLDREDSIEQAIESGTLYGSVEHVGRAIGEDSRSQPRLLQGGQCTGDFRECIKRQIELHQPMAQTGVVDPQGLQRKIESVARHLTEIHVPTLESPQPRGLKLLVAPESGQLVDVIAEHIAAPPRSCSKVEQSSVGVKDACFHALQGTFGHVAHLPNGCWRSSSRVLR